MTGKYNTYGLRPMKSEDMTLVWRWRNAPSIRETSYNTDIISWDTHKDWLVSGYPRFKYILTENERSIGVVILNDDHYWSFYIDPELPKRQGYGLILLALALKEFKGMGRIYAKVKTSNKASLNLHKQLGFKVLKRTADIVTLGRGTHS